MIRLNDARAIHSRSPPQAGNFVEVRGRRWLVEEVEAGQPSTASLSCIDDDAQGDELRVIWDVELDARLLDDDPWSYLARAEAQDEADEEAAAEQASLLGARGGEAADLRAELAAVNEMLAIAENAKTRADARSRWLKSWIIENLLDRSDWNDRRLIVFTEYEDTRRWLERRLKEAIADTDRADERIAVVQVHLEHRLVRRLLGRFLSQGFQSGLNRACVILGPSSPRTMPSTLTRWTSALAAGVGCWRSSA